MSNLKIAYVQPVFFLLAMGCNPSAKSIAFKYETEHQYQYEVITKLKLSTKQKKTFQEMQAYFQDKINWMQANIADRAKLRGEFMKMQVSFDEELKALLSNKQYTLYLELLEGKSSNFQPVRIQKTI